MDSFSSLRWTGICKLLSVQHMRHWPQDFGCSYGLALTETSLVISGHYVGTRYSTPYNMQFGIIASLPLEDAQKGTGGSTEWLHVASVETRVYPRWHEVMPWAAERRDSKNTAPQWAHYSQHLTPLMLKHSVLNCALGGIICAAEKQAEHCISSFKRINF